MSFVKKGGKEGFKRPPAALIEMARKQLLNEVSGE